MTRQPLLSVAVNCPSRAGPGPVPPGPSVGTRQPAPKAFPGIMGVQEGPQWQGGKGGREGPLKRLHLRLRLEELRLPNLSGRNSSRPHLLHTHLPCARLHAKGFHEIFFNPHDNSTRCSYHDRPCFTDEEPDGGLARSQNSSKVIWLVNSKPG